MFLVCIFKIFNSLTQEVNINQYHWAVSPDLAHYVQDRPVMHSGYKENQLLIEPQEVKQEPHEDPDIVW